MTDTDFERSAKAHLWSRIWRGLRQFQVAMDVDVRDHLDDRIRLLEQQVAELKAATVVSSDWADLSPDPDTCPPRQRRP